MQTIHESKYLRAAVKEEKKRGRSVAFVPTMGNLHAGHLQLVKRAHELADCVIVSIFVNPMQFGANEDLDTYPRTPQEDQLALEALNTHYLFTPSVATMYPAGIQDHTRVSISELGSQLCGKTRPVFFEGICTVVSKLFNLVQPDIAVFGEKDYQQLTIIRRMVADLCMPIEIIGVPTTREENGLAMSSRNNYLSPGQKDTAAEIYKKLCEVRNAITDGNTNYQQLCADAKGSLTEKGFEPDYFELRNGNNLEHVSDGETAAKLVLLVAANLGSTRLIDNIAFQTKTD